MGETPLWRVEGLSLGDGVPMGTGTHWLSVERFPDFDRAFRQAGASMNWPVTSATLS
mgnify:CR=1 FL=1